MQWHTENQYVKSFDTQEPSFFHAEERNNAAHEIAPQIVYLPEPVKSTQAMVNKQCEHVCAGLNMNFILIRFFLWP